MTTKTYFLGQGTYQKVQRELSKLIPSEGRVAQPRKNKALESFRKASNAYYELYNNGLCNGNTEFRAAFGILPSQYKFVKDNGAPAFMADMYKEVETAMDNIVLMAALEQGLMPLNEVPDASERDAALQAKADRAEFEAEADAEAAIEAEMEAEA